MLLYLCLGVFLPASPVGFPTCSSRNIITLRFNLTTACSLGLIMTQTLAPFSSPQHSPRPLIQGGLASRLYLLFCFKRGAASLKREICALQDGLPDEVGDGRGKGLDERAKFGQTVTTFLASVCTWLLPSSFSPLLPLYPILVAISPSLHI